MAELNAREQKRNHILKKAMELFSRQGIHKTKVSEIAEAAGVGKGTLYEYFKSKDDIFWSGAASRMQEFDEAFTKRVQTIQEPEAKLNLFISTAFEFYKKHFEENEITFEIWIEYIRIYKEFGHNSSKIRCVLEIQSKYDQWLISTLEDGIRQKKFREINPQVVAAVIISTFDGMKLQQVTGQFDFDLAEAGQVVIDTIINGIKA